MMGKVIAGTRIVPAWLGAVAHIENSGRRCRNLMVEIDDPDTVTPADKRVISLVDESLRKYRNTSVLTVAGTIFPQGLYRRYGAATLASRFLPLMNAAKKKGTWGTYATRLMCRPNRKGDGSINPLALMVNKLKRAAGTGSAFVSNYELGVQDARDLLESEPFGCDVPLYSPSEDATMVRNQPCLSHLSFKLIDKTELELTAIYRSHYYAERALGNFIGLRHLMNFVASEAGVHAGRMTCISTDAYLDYENWGDSTNSGRLVLKAIRDAVAVSDQSTQISDACVAG